MCGYYIKFRPSYDQFHGSPSAAGQRSWAAKDVRINKSAAARLKPVITLPLLANLSVLSQTPLVYTRQPFSFFLISSSPFSFITHSPFWPPLLLHPLVLHFFIFLCRFPITSLNDNDTWAISATPSSTLDHAVMASHRPLISLLRIHVLRQDRTRQSVDRGTELCVVVVHHHQPSVDVAMMLMIKRLRASVSVSVLRCAERPEEPVKRRS